MDATSTSSEVRQKSESQTAGQKERELMVVIYLFFMNVSEDL